MRVAGIALNLTGALLLFLGGWVALAIHSAHSLSVDHELRTRAGLDEKKVTIFVEGDPRLPDGTYDTYTRIRTTGNVESNLTWLCGAGILMLLLNTLGWALAAKPKPEGTGTAGAM